MPPKSPPSVPPLESGDGGPGDDARSFLLRHREGDPAAFAELVTAYRAPIYSYLCRSGVGEASRDDLFQEVFLRVHRAAAQYDAERPLHPWLFTIVANTVRNHQRRRRIRDLVFSPSTPIEPADTRPEGERKVSGTETVAWLGRQLDRLSALQRQVVLLACVEHLPLKDIAEALEIPLNTVKSNLRRARIALVRDLTRRQRGEAVQ